MFAEHIYIELDGLGPRLGLRIGLGPVRGDKMAGLNVHRANPAVELRVAKVPDFAVDFCGIANARLALNFFAELHVMVGVANRIVLIEVDARLVKMISPCEVRSLGDQGKRHIVDLIGIGKTAVLLLDQRE